MNPDTRPLALSGEEKVAVFWLGLLRAVTTKKLLETSAAVMTTQVKNERRRGIRFNQTEMRNNTMG